MQRFDEAVAWSELAPEPKDEFDDEDEPDDDEDEPDEDAPEPELAPQEVLFFREEEPADPIELYRRDEMVVATQNDWHMALLIFQEMGWQPARHLESYARPLTFVKHDEGGAMQRAGRSLFAVIQDAPIVSASVQMDLGLFYRLTEFVGGGGFIVGRQGSYEQAKANDFSKF